jgi:hypothetical protein
MNHTGLPCAEFTSSTAVEVEVESICMVPDALVAPRYSEFAIRIKKFLAGGRTREDGAVVHRAEQVRPHIYLARVAKPARSQLDTLEPFAVGAESSVVVHSARQVRPVDRIDFAARGFLKINHAESLFRIGYDLGDLGRPLRERTDSAQRGDVRAPGQIFKNLRRLGLENAELFMRSTSVVPQAPFRGPDPRNRYPGKSAPRRCS